MNGLTTAAKVVKVTVVNRSFVPGAGGVKVPRSGDRRTLKAGRTVADAWGDMTTIRTTCPRCGEVDMGPEAIALSVRSNGREGSYRFTCPNCSDDVEKRADRKIVALLVSAGVDIDRSLDEGASPELFDEEGVAAPAYTGPPFTIDDVIEFHFLLEDDASIREFLASSGG